MMDRDAELLTKAKAAIMGVNRAFGPPGDYGYSTKEGKALNELYNLHNEIADELKLLSEMEAAMAEPLSADEEAAVERSWQRFRGDSDRADLLAALSDLLANHTGLNADRARAAIAKAEGNQADEPWDVEISHN